MKKISFLMAVHNEEKILEESLEHLSKNIPYENYEVLVGLDGCEDKSLEIVKKFIKNEPDKFRYFAMDERNGKPPVINGLIKEAKGEIIIINDADWKFTTVKSTGIKELIALFDDPKIGGVVESFPVEWDLKKEKSKNFGYKMVAYSAYFWLNYQKKKLAKSENYLGQITSPDMWLTNIFRKKLYKENVSLGDDFERTQDIFKENFKLVFFKEESMPRMIAIYDKISIKDLFKQKIRTAIARKQINEKTPGRVSTKNYYIPVCFYMIKESLKERKIIFVFPWIAVTSVATIFSKFKHESTKEGWKRRVTR